MLKIGTFSKLSRLTVKALRFYEKEGILMPASIDRWTGYRFYETVQLVTASQIKLYRRLGLSVKEIKALLSGADEKKILKEKAETLILEKKDIDYRLSEIYSILEDRGMTYQVNIKTVPKKIVYSSETVLGSYSELMEWIPSVGQECLELNPGIECDDSGYEFCEYLDGEYRETNIRVRHSEAVKSFGNENEHIKFRVLPEAKVLSIFHKGPYDSLPSAYSFILKYAEENGLKCAGTARECYIDGIWNKESEKDWLTEIQLPIE